MKKENTECQGVNDQGLPKYGVLDQFQQKVVSRKLLVFIAATCLMIWSTLDPETWAMIATMYIGGQSVIDVAKVWKGM